jgi:hypothetical protein
MVLVTLLFQDRISLKSHAWCLPPEIYLENRDISQSILNFGIKNNPLRHIMTALGDIQVAKLKKPLPMRGKS